MSILDRAIEAVLLLVALLLFLAALPFVWLARRPKSELTREDQP